MAQEMLAFTGKKTNLEGHMEDKKRLMLLALYNVMMRASTPLLSAYLKKREKRGKEDPARAAERRGQALLSRPPGPLVWFHAASVGESLSLLALVHAVLAMDPGIRVLVTTGTVTSARLMAERLPARAFHQYVPVDHPVWVARFLDHWRPDLALWTESEFWPNLMAAMRKRSIPAVLLNARMSQESFRHWRYVRGLMRDILSTFKLCLAQNVAEAERLRALGGADVRVSSNLKYAAVPLPYDPAKLAKLQQDIGSRPCLLWVSTHAGEEEMARDTHRTLCIQYPDLLTIIVPRHPARGEEITQMVATAGVAVARRSLDDELSSVTGIYVADTMGELGLFFRACKSVIMGGSFADIGGHNPIEPAQLGGIIFFGPMTYNFLTIMEDFRKENAVIDVTDKEDLLQKLQEHLADPKRYAPVGEAAAQMTAAKSSVVAEVMGALQPFLDDIVAPTEKKVAS
jgi:3-deoxy-D-manno-octulosonic-acid transferase